MSRRVSPAVAIGIALPSLIAGIAVGMLLRADPSVAAAVKPRSAPVAPASPAPAEPPPAPKTAADAVPPPAARPRNFADRWNAIGLRKLDLKKATGVEKAFHEFQAVGLELQEAMMKDPEGYIAILRSPESEPLLPALLSLLSRFPGIGAGPMLLPVAQIPRPVLDAVRDLLVSGTAAQKVAVLELAVGDSWAGESTLLAKDVMAERCTSMLADADPRVRAAAVPLLQRLAPEQADRRFEVLQEIWHSGPDEKLRNACLQALAALPSREARDLSFKAVGEIVADPVAVKDWQLMGTSLQIVQQHARSTRTEDIDGTAAVCSAALKSVQDPRMYAGWVDAALFLPLPRATSLLEQAQSSAPSPELRSGAVRVLEQIRAGETRTDRLRTALSPQK
jgi:hypothetical protein